MRATEFSEFQYGAEPYESWTGTGIVIRAYHNKKEIGHVIFEPTEDDETQWYAVDVEVDDAYQHKGIATSLYDRAKAITKKKGIIIVRSQVQSPAGAGFWNKYRGKTGNVWESLNR